MKQFAFRNGAGTGFWGSGKTTLLNASSRNKHGKRIAVIENEFGEVAVRPRDWWIGGAGGGKSRGDRQTVCICCAVGRAGNWDPGFLKQLRQQRAIASTTC